MSAERVSITDKGRAVIQSSLSLRQAHEIETGCCEALPCLECQVYMIGERE